MYIEEYYVNVYLFKYIFEFVNIYVEIWFQMYSGELRVYVNIYSYRLIVFYGRGVCFQGRRIGLVGMVN